MENRKSTMKGGEKTLFRSRNLMGPKEVAENREEKNRTTGRGGDQTYLLLTRAGIFIQTAAKPKKKGVGRGGKQKERKKTFSIQPPEGRGGPNKPRRRSGIRKGTPTQRRKSAPRIRLKKRTYFKKGGHLGGSLKRGRG